MTEAQALSRIAAYCSKAERSEYDVRKKLEAWQIDKDQVGSIVSRLKKENFLNEERFCQAFIKDKLRFNKWGKNKIVFELRKKRISDKTIEKTFLQLDVGDDFEDALKKLLTSKLPAIKAKDNYEKKVKLYRFALGRGYSPDAIQKCLNRLLENSDAEDFI
ncbi:MAG: regulatory protein RecX [Dysgonomonas sp.]